jgi:hypothetical protein
MAVGAVTPKAIRDIGGTDKLITGTISLAADASWLAAGEVISITGVEYIEELIVTGGSGAATGYKWEWEPNGQKLLAFRVDQTDDPQEAVPDTTDLSGLTALRFLAIGQ